MNVFTDVSTSVLMAAFQSDCRILSHDQLPPSKYKVLRTIGSKFKTVSYLVPIMSRINTEHVNEYIPEIQKL